MESFEREKLYEIPKFEQEEKSISQFENSTKSQPQPNAGPIDGSQKITVYYLMHSCVEQFSMLKIKADLSFSL